MRTIAIFLSTLSLIALQGCGSSSDSATVPDSTVDVVGGGEPAQEQSQQPGQEQSQEPNQEQSQEPNQEQSQEPGQEPTQGAAEEINIDGSLISIGAMEFVGAFALPSAKDDVSSLNFATGVIEVNGDSLFIAGHDHDDAIAEFAIPPLVASTQISDLHVAAEPQQSFVKILDRAASGNPDSLNDITGLELVGSKLIVNAVEFYDGPGDNRLSTLVVDNAFDLRGSTVSEFRSLEGLARAAGWISEVPDDIASVIGGSHISGFSSGGPIISRLSVGPSAFVVDFESVQATDFATTIETKEILGFSLDRPLNSDLLNATGENKLWTHVSQAAFGFIVPGTKTYLTVGVSGGHDSGIGYKITQNDGNLCGGFCSYGAQDNYNFYWLWNLDDLLRVDSGAASPDSIRPYEFGRLDLPFQTDDRFNAIGGASFDSQRNLLYVSVLKANNELGQFDNPPIIVAYRVNVR